MPSLFENIQHNIHNQFPPIKSPGDRGVIVIGGGLAGLIAAFLLARRDISVTLIEKKSYPFHRVCGEYISNEARPFLLKQGLFPQEFSPPEISELELTSVNGRSAFAPLDLGGFGISRYVFDHFLYRKAANAGVRFLLKTEVTNIAYQDDEFRVHAGDSVLIADVVLAAFGKRSRIDHVMKRKFIQQRSAYAAVKYHVQCAGPQSRIALHNFRGGYCGLSRVENGVSNLCYLTHRDNLKKYKSVQAMEEAVLFRNPFLKNIFEQSKFVFEKPEVINEISFATKSAVENHVLMAGDAAGMITPLCGNGMAMAIHSATVAARWIANYMMKGIDRSAMETGYGREWNRLFARRLWIGRKVQRLFGSELASDVAVNIARYSKPLTRWLVSSTHGDVF